MGLSNFNTLFTAFLLKWIKEGRLTIEPQETASLFKRRQSQLSILERKMPTDTLEKKLFTMIEAVTPADGSGGSTSSGAGVERDNFAILNGVSVAEAYRSTISNNMLIKHSHFWYS